MRSEMIGPRPWGSRCVRIITRTTKFLPTNESYSNLFSRRDAAIVTFIIGLDIPATDKQIVMFYSATIAMTATIEAMHGEQTCTIVGPAFPMSIAESVLIKVCQVKLWGWANEICANYLFP
jgi:hypothetical protein